MSDEKKDFVVQKYIKASFGEEENYQISSITSTSRAKLTIDLHQYLLGDHQVPPTCPKIAKESKKL